MTNKELKGNAILGYYVSDEFFKKLGFCYPTPMFQKGKILPEHCKFHSSYEWLMELSEILDSDSEATLTIEDVDVSITVGGQALSSGELFDCDFETSYNSESKKENLFNALVEYVDWYTNSEIDPVEGEVQLVLIAHNNHENMHEKEVISVSSREDANGKIELFKMNIEYTSYYIDITPRKVLNKEEESWLEDQDWNY